ncbi:MAG: polysaccharide deacetylase [Oscillospiraceae bacterium]|nr:polysaccharide deacetylase [Oscillospiraceae bacterium]
MKNSSYRDYTRQRKARVSGKGFTIFVCIALLIGAVVSVGGALFTMARRNALSKEFDALYSQNLEALTRITELKSRTGELTTSNAGLSADIETVETAAAAGTDTNVALQKQAKDILTEINTYLPVDRKLPDEEKYVYLTFDDGPTPVTPKILDVLAAKKVKATFFVIGCNTDYQHNMKRIAEEGHAIGLHSFSHDYKKVYKSEDAFWDEFNRLNAIVKAQTGSESRVIRFPGGASNTISKFNPGIMTRLTKDVEEKGYVYVDWNVYSGDADGGNVSADSIVSRVISDTGNQKNAVVLMHDAADKNTTVQALPRIIDYYAQKGYMFETLTTESPACRQKVAN